MLHAFKLGPIEVGRDRVNVYAAVGENGISRPAFAKSDAKGLRELADAARGEALRCEPALAAARKKLGFVPGPLPKEALVAQHGEARLPPEERFEVGELRRELGLPKA